MTFSLQFTLELKNIRTKGPRDLKSIFRGTCWDLMLRAPGLAEHSFQLHHQKGYS